MTLSWRWLGRIDHRGGISAQEAIRTRLLNGDDSAACVLLCEHFPVITLGRNADRDHVLASTDGLFRAGIAVEQTGRGGDVTYHGPGQLMVYPGLQIRGQVVAFLARLAAALADVAAFYGVPGARWQRDPAGLWLAGTGSETAPAKLAACGIHLRRGAVLHGFALNIATPPARWALIKPCGLSAPVTSLAIECATRGLPPPPSVAEVATRAGPLVAKALDMYV